MEWLKEFEESGITYREFILDRDGCPVPGTLWRSESSRPGGPLIGPRGKVMTSNLDLIVIGTGAGAAGLASKCRASGWNVAIIDSRPYGGTCALRGCDPKKVLVGASEAVD